MVQFEASPTQVVGPGGVRYNVKPGDPWPVPYRGMRLTVRSNQGKPRLCFARKDILLPAVWPLNMKEALEQVKTPPLGSLRVTGHLNVVTRVQDPETGLWLPRYVGKLDGVPHIQGFDHAPSSLERGSLWTGLNFYGGETWSVAGKIRLGDFLSWRRAGGQFFSTQEYPALCAVYRAIRPRGGRLYVVPGGHLWMNVPPNEVGSEWKQKLAQQWAKDHRRLTSSSGVDPLIRLIHERREATATLPVYLGHISEFADHSNEAPWTRFELAQLFGKGTEREDEDDEVEAWKK